MLPGWTGKKVLTELRSFAGLKGWRGASRLGIHSCRRGAVRAIREAGGPFSQLLRSGLWHSSAYQLYLDLGHEESRAVASMLIEVSAEERDTRGRDAGSKSLSYDGPTDCRPLA